MDSNKYASVTQVNQYIRGKFNSDQKLQKVAMIGEVSNFRLRPGGHQYFSLKDDHTKISAVMFKWQFAHVKFRPENGMKVVVFGRVGTYPRFGEYQFYIYRMSPAGIGQLYEALMQTKKQLMDAGIFNPSLKKSLPIFPKRIAVITSPNGAVIRDIIVTARRRYPLVQIVLFPSLVQNQGCTDNLVRQIKRVSKDGNFDDLIIGRGGGSLEDLWGFESKQVALALYHCPIPVISSVGHETDTTITDLVADKRAATPTAAAELATPVRLVDLVSGIQDFHDRIIKAFKAQLSNLSQQLKKVQNSYVFKTPTRLYETYIQEVDSLTDGLHKLLNNYTDHYLDKVNLDKQSLSSAFKELLGNKRLEMQKSVGALDQLSPLKTLSRGYSLVTKHGNIIKNKRLVKPGDNIRIRFSNGSRDAKITGNQNRNHGFSQTSLF